ncbi:pentapeptide repeat-containing protein, partial [Methanococcoides alaskense]
SFNRTQIEGSAFFNPATFEGEANFGSARIGSTAVFTGAEFKEKASFNRTQIEGSAFFNPATFEGEANFGSARIGSNAQFAGAEFKEKASFNRTQIEGSAFFNPATFEGEANFGSARIGSTAVFTGAEFKERAVFNRTQIEGSAFFNPAIFEGEANFVGARIGSNAQFAGAEFKEKASFNSAQIQRESHFERTIFANYVSFENTSFETIYFGEPEVQFQAKIDLRGCIYNRIDPISFWEQLMKHLDPYDQQPFTQLEETFRRAGKDKLADDVYYEQKRRESGQKTLRTPSAWLLDRFLWLVTGYGVRLHRLSAFIALILLSGTIIFHFEGAVEPMLNMQPPLHLSYWEAFWVSLNTFLPVEIPSGANWIPSSKSIVLGIRFTTFATLLKLAGWIFVPVGIAGISGILKR